MFPVAVQWSGEDAVLTLPISVLLADDHAAMRRGTRSILEVDPRLRVVAEAIHGEQAMEFFRKLQPAVMVLDVELPRLTGIEVIRQVRRTASPCAILMLSAYDDPSYVLSALRAGANGYVLKTAEPDDLIAAVLAVADGQLILDRALSVTATAFAVNDRLSGADGRSGQARGTLSVRELDVLKLVARGLTNKAIGVTMRISDRTVQVHIANIFTKLGAASRTDAAMIALRHGLVSLS